MSYESTTDAFVVVSGPEDGAEFPVTKGRFELGRAQECMVSVRLDESIADLHARATVVSDGYLIRACGPSPVYVNGRRAGLIFSRIVRHGGRLQVGGTMLICRCAPDGLARRSHGIRHASDLAWGAHRLGLGTGWLVSGAFRAARHFVRFRMSGTLAPVLVFAGVYLFYPPFRYWTHSMVRWLRDVVSGMMGQVGF